MEENRIDLNILNTEVERLVNVAEGMGWEKVSQKLDEEEVVIALRREVELPKVARGKDAK
jgi:hypothetical protein